MEDRDGDVAKAILDYETTIKSLQSKAKKLQDKVDKPIDRTDAEDVKAHNDAKVELGNINEQIQLYSQALNYLQEMLPSEVNNVQETETNDEVETPTNEVEEQPTGNTQETTKRTFEYFKGSLKDLIALGKNATEKLNKMLFSNVSERLEKDLKGKGLNVTTKFKHVIDDQHIKHTLNNHAIGKEEDRGQIEIQEKDFEQLKDVYDNYNEISASKNKRGDDVVIYIKNNEDGTILVVEEIHSRHNELVFDSMRKYKNRNLSGETLLKKPNSYTSETTPDSVSADKGRKETEQSKQQGNPFQFTDNEILNLTDNKDFNNRLLSASNLAKSLGVKLNLATEENSKYLDHNSEEYKAIQNNKANAWFKIDEGAVYLYVPANVNRTQQQLESTIIHEIVAHKGIRDLLSKEDYNKFLENVWNLMPYEWRLRGVAYMKGKISWGNSYEFDKWRVENERDIDTWINDVKTQRGVADEFVALISENPEMVIFMTLIMFQR